MQSRSERRLLGQEELTAKSGKTATAPNTKISSHERAEISILEIKNLQAAVEGKKILKGIDLVIKSGEIHAIMGPNGSGKSTLCRVLMGHPKYETTGGSIKLNGEDILELEPNERAKLGLFMGFQHPMEIAGVTLGNFLRLASRAKSRSEQSERRLPSGKRKSKNTDQGNLALEPLSPLQFLPILKKKLDLLKMDYKFISRYVNEGFSGGEKKRAEVAQMAVLEPKIALLDEIDSGLDIDALKIVANGIRETFKKTNSGILLVTHYKRLLEYITPDYVHVMSGGKIVKSGGPELAQKLEKEGYKQFERTVRTKREPKEPKY